MKKLGCAQCGKSMKKGGAKKMAKGGSANVNISKPGAGYAKAQTGGDNQKNFIYGMPTTTTANAGIATMKKGGTKKSFPDMSGDGKVTAKDILMAKGVIKKPKAKFGMSVKVQPGKIGKVTAPDRGYKDIGEREMDRITFKKSKLNKKAAGGPIIDKLKAKLAERKVTKAIKKSVKSSGKIINK